MDTFLDTKVKVDLSNNMVYTDLHTKDTDIYKYLHYTSAHPCHWKKIDTTGNSSESEETVEKIRILKLMQLQEWQTTSEEDTLRRKYWQL